MLLFHEVLINSIHLFAGPAPVIRGSFLGCLDRYTSENQATVSDDTGMLAVLNRGCLVVRMFIRPDGLIALTQSVEHITLILLTSDRGANPAMLIPFGCRRGVKDTGRSPRLAARF